MLLSSQKQICETSTEDYAVAGFRGLLGSYWLESMKFMHATEEH